MKYSSVQCQSREDGGTSWQQEREEEEEEQEGAVVVNWMNLLRDWKTSVSAGDFHSSTEQQRQTGDWER